MAEEIIMQENVEMEENNGDGFAIAPIAGGLAIAGIVAFGAVKAFQYFKSKAAAAAQDKNAHVEVEPKDAAAKDAEEDNNEK